MNKIITIAREFGSGGRELGQRIAEKLKIAYYDKEILTEIAKNTSLAVEYVQQVVENNPAINFPITVGGTLVHNYAAANNNISIYAEQCKVIKELAEKSSCVIVGRCADYILKDQKPFRIFVYSDIETKVARCLAKEDLGLSKRKLIKKIKNIDKQRKNYYNFYTSLEWGNKLNYDICINTSGKDISSVVDEIVSILE